MFFTMSRSATAPRVAAGVFGGDIYTFPMAPQYLNFTFRSTVAENLPVSSTVANFILTSVPILDRSNC